MSNTDILRRLQELEKENQRLQKLVGKSDSPKETTTHVSMFKGHPVITFSGPFRPFSLGIRKASVIIEKLQDLKYFVENNQKHLKAGQDDPPEATPV
jgi:hypothetical protein